MQVTTIGGKTLVVDISDEACKMFGFKHGDRFIERNRQRHGTIIGVAPKPPNGSDGNNEAMLWVSLDGDDGEVCHFTNPRSDLKKM
jgi:hypothetical protein